MTEKPEHKLWLFNSLSRKKEEFQPPNSNRVTMYNCGPTVYSYAHIGNARAAVAADILFRLLRHLYGGDHVIYARNITDVDDKIIKAATEQQVDISAITQKYTRIYQDDLAALACLPPTHEPKATDNISGMISMIETLLDKGYAYARDGHVFFDVEQYEQYGQLSGNTLSALKKGDRVGEAEYARKKNAADFVLWKPPADGVGWEAPFGQGRPGWHIECSAMAKAILGETIDIHCGGVDLKFPHHENEIAQSHCANEAALARFWIHNEFLNMGAEKMSKSLGNVQLIHDLLTSWDGEVIRLSLLKAHYRSELIWTDALLKESKAQLDGWYRAIKDQPIAKKFIKVDPHMIRFLSDDMATPAAIGRINQLLDEIYAGEIIHVKKAGLLIGSARFLGLLTQDPDMWFKGKTSDQEEVEINALIAERDAAKMAALKAKQSGNKALMGQYFARSDAIRAELQKRGIILEDGPDGTSWRRE